MTGTALQWVKAGVGSDNEWHLVWAIDELDAGSDYFAICGARLPAHLRRDENVGEFVPINGCNPCRHTLQRQVGL